MDSYSDEDYLKMAQDTLDRTKDFADDEQKKTIIAFMDDKLVLVRTTFLQIGFDPARNWKLEDVAYWLQGYM